MNVRRLDLSLIVAMTPDRTIGANGALPWHLPSDLARFKEITTGIGTVIMGRKTYQSILARNGGPLAGRYNIVLSKQCSMFLSPSVEFVTSLEEALGATTGRGGRACIIGGAQIYKLFMPYVQTAYVTLIQAAISGDTYFPEK